MFSQNRTDFSSIDLQAPIPRFGTLDIAPALPHERLPFTVKIVQNQTDLWKAVHIRHAAYARHVPLFAKTLAMPERQDTENGVVVLLAESKLDGSALGTMRIQTNQFCPLSLEQSIELPARLARRPLAEATRLGVTDDRVGRLVKTVLFKAFFLYCRRNLIESMVVSGRFPIDRQYERLLFSEVYPGMGFIPMEHVGNLPHRIMSFDIGTADARWHAAQHPLYKFIFETLHPDIDIGPHNVGFCPAAREKVQIHPAFVAKMAVKNM